MKFVITLTIGLLFQLQIFAQFETTENTNSNLNSTTTKKAKTPFLENVVVGGGLDLQFGNYTFISLTPLVAYAITDDFFVGNIFTYKYYRSNISGQEYVSNIYGSAPFARYFIFKGLFAHAEYEMLHGEFYYNAGETWIDNLLVGGGYASRFGDHGFAGVYVLWNLTEDPNNVIYNGPIFRINFGVNL